MLRKRPEGRFVMSGVAWFALDADLAERLWEESLRMLDL